MRASLLALALSLAACNSTRSGDALPVDAGAPDATPDAGTFDAGPLDSGTPLDAAHDAPTTGEGGMCGGSLMQSPTCEACLESMCCMEVTTCNATPGCPTVFECLHHCASGDGTCYTGCLSGTSGVGESSQVDGCILMHCPPTCRAM